MAQKAQQVKHPADVRPSSDLIFRGVLYALTLFLSLPLHFASVVPGLDASGSYILNIAPSLGLKMGSEIFSTYGPLGFLCKLENFGNNVAVGLLVYGGVVLLEACLLFPIYFRIGERSTVRLAITTVLLWPVLQMAFDLYLASLLLLALGLAWFSGQKWQKRYFAIACLLAVFTAFVKFSGCILAFSSLVIFVLVLFFKDRTQSLRLGVLVLSVPVLFVAFFLLYNPSLQGLIGYVRSAMELSGGYSTAMSFWTEYWAKTLSFAVVTGGAYCVILTLVLWADRERGLFMLIFCGPFFTVFKLGFVRADGHTDQFFQMFLAFLLLISLFLDFHKLREQFSGRMALSLLSAAVVFLAVAIPVSALNWAPRDYFNRLRNIQQQLTGGIANTINTPIAGADPLSEALLEQIGDIPTAVFPWEYSIFAYNDLNIEVMPVFAGFSAYTPYLDELNAQYFSDEARAPDQVLFRRDAIDNRLPLLDMPATWAALQTYYTAVYFDNVYLLLSRVETPQSAQIVPLSQETCEKAAVVQVPAGQGPVSMEVQADLTFWGRLSKFFYQIPEVNLTLTYASGHVYTGRVLPELLSSGATINYYPCDLSQCVEVLTQGKIYDPVVSFQFSGPGWAFYKDAIKISFFEDTAPQQTYNDCMNFYAEQKPDPTTGLSAMTNGMDTIIDMVNEQPPVDSLSVFSGQGIRLRGWAFDAAANASPEKIYVRLGERYFEMPAVDSADLTAYFNNPGYNRARYDGILNTSGLEPGTYDLVLVVLSADGQSYFERTISTVTILV
ncbi:hypothetical protein [Oscillibacter sp.]|uniref:hypothetical protein n=1 Tax=Oscillibacter sp. TaxID=1945593 RepID=UPI0028A9ADC1|nr:hypothetical protein [Oscillibacter sp.]